MPPDRSLSPSETSLAAVRPGEAQRPSALDGEGMRLRTRPGRIRRPEGRGPPVQKMPGGGSHFRILGRKREGEGKHERGSCNTLVSEDRRTREAASPSHASSNTEGNHCVEFPFSVASKSSFSVDREFPLPRVFSPLRLPSSVATLLPSSSPLAPVFPFFRLLPIRCPEKEIYN